MMEIEGKPENFFQWKFIELQIEKYSSNLFDLQNQRLAYQKLYMALMTIVAAFAIAMLNFFGRTASSQPEANVPNTQETLSLVGKNIEPIIGIFLLIALAIGITVVRYLAAVRVQEIWLVVRINKILLYINGRFPELREASLTNLIPHSHWKGADMWAILIFNIANCGLVIACSLLFAGFEGRFRMILTSLIGMILYGIICHKSIIEPISYAKKFADYLPEQSD